MNIKEVFKKAIEEFHWKGTGAKFRDITPGFGLILYYKPDGKPTVCDLSEVFIDPKFWKLLSRIYGWGQEITKTKTGAEHGERFCLHCGVSIDYQPSREIMEKTGCAHVQYPYACKVCSKKQKSYNDYWHELVEHLDKGKSLYSFFSQL